MASATSTPLLFLPFVFPLKVIQERLGHASAGLLTLDVYTHAEWEENVEAAKLAGEKLEKAVNSVKMQLKKKSLRLERRKLLKLRRIAGRGGWI